MTVKNYSLKLKVLSPIHIGSGETLNPLRYLVKNGRLYFINEGQYIKKLLKMTNSRLKQVVEDTDIYSIVNYFVDCFDEKDSSTWTNSYEVSSDYEALFTKNLRNPDNQNLLFEFIRSKLFHEPIIPGSSLKGAIRTALLFGMNKKLSVNPVMTYDKYKKREIANSQLTEAEIMNMNIFNDRFDVKSDPFKYIKVSDINLSSDSLTVNRIENRTSGRPSGIPYYAEVLKKTDLIYTGSLSINSDFSRNLNEPFRLKADEIAPFIIKNCKDFYNKIVVKDYNLLKGIQLQNSLATVLKTIESNKENPNKAVIRLGKGQGCHSLSINTSELNPKSRNLAENYPLGWAEIELVEI